MELYEIVLHLPTWTTQMQSISTQMFNPASIPVKYDICKKVQETIRHLMLKAVSLLRFVHHLAINIARKTV